MLSDFMTGYMGKTAIQSPAQRRNAQSINGGWVDNRVPFSPFQARIGPHDGPDAQQPRIAPRAGYDRMHDLQFSRALEERGDLNQPGPPALGDNSLPFSPFQARIGPHDGPDAQQPRIAPRAYSDPRADPLNQGFVEERGDLNQRGSLLPGGLGAPPLPQTKAQLAEAAANRKRYADERAAAAAAAPDAAAEGEGNSPHAWNVAKGFGLGSGVSALLDFARNKPVSVRRMILMGIFAGAGNAIFQHIGGFEGISASLAGEVKQ